MAKKITKAVIPAAGFGTRFLPQTKAMPKQMMPIVDKPIIQYVVEQLVDAGITDIIMVTNYHERAIEDHFDKPHGDLIENLKAGGEKKKPLLEEIERISEMANVVYVRQKGPYGNGTPLLNVRHLVGDEPFIYTWSDEFIMSNPNVFTQLMTAYEKYDCTCLAGVKVREDDDYNRFGFAAGRVVDEGVIDTEQLIEKPGKKNAPSDLATNTAYLLTPNVFDYLETAVAESPGGAELYYNDVLKLMLRDGKRIMTIEIKNGKYYDTGNKFEYLKTVVEFGLKHPEIGEEFGEWLKGINKL